MGGKNLGNQPIPNDPKHFPPAPTWMSWVGEVRYKRDARGYIVQDKNGAYVIDDAEVGKVRYHWGHMDARKSLMWLGRESTYRHADDSGRFYQDWYVYEWTGKKWELRGSGRKGEKRSENPFFDLKKIKDRSNPLDKAVEKHEEAVEQEAIESILRAAKKE